MTVIQPPKLSRLEHATHALNHLRQAVTENDDSETAWAVRHAIDWCEYAQKRIEGRA